MRAFGFTLIELLITLSIASILLGVGLPSFTSQIQHSQVQTTAQSLLESLELTRTQAVFANQRATIRNQTNWEDGWAVFLDKNNNGLVDPNEKVIQKHEQIKGVRIIANRPIKNYVSFISSGEARHANGTVNAGAFQAGTFTICPEAKGKGYELILARGGRVRTNNIDAETCAAI